MIKAVFMSLKPKNMELILKKEKTFEFRNYLPKKEINTIFIYESLPVGELKYIIKIGKIKKYPERLVKKGIGNEEFNNGNKPKYAYEIKELYKLNYAISLNTLKEKYEFNPPQAYIYAERNFRLTNYILNCKMQRIF